MSNGINVNPLNDITKVYLNQIATAKAKETEKDIERWTQAEETDCNETPKGKDCDVHGMKECPDPVQEEMGKKKNCGCGQNPCITYGKQDNKSMKEEKKAKKDYDGDGKVESGSKEHAGVVHNAIQKKKGGKADGQDTRKESTLHDLTKVYLNQVANVSEHHKKDEDGNTIPHEDEVTEAMSSYDKARKAAARRAADRNAARRRGEMGGRMERETYTNEAGTRMHHKGYRANANEGRTYTWRDDINLREVMTDDGEQKEVTEKKVKNKIKINPKLGEAIEEIGGEVLEAYTVTNADKKGNTPAYQGYKAGKKNVKTGKPMYKAADHMKEEEVDEGYGKKKKKKGHSCASKVKHEEYGMGDCIKEMHTLTEDGEVTHYDIKFSNRIIRNVPVDSLEVIEEMHHEHYVNDEKNVEVFGEEDKKGSGSGTKDACYKKVKASAKVWPSAYASGRLVQCRKKGAANYGKSKSESYSWRDDFIWEDEDQKKNLTERPLSQDEEGDKERIVKGMKKDTKGFKNRYGDDYKSVMYATATKLAKEETETIGGVTVMQDYDETIQFREYETVDIITPEPMKGVRTEEMEPKKEPTSNMDDKKSAEASKKVDQKQKRVAMMKKIVLQKKLQAVRSGAGGDIVAGYEPEGEMVDEGSLHKWFKGSKSKDGKGGWVNVVTGGTCASDEPGEGTPKCVSSSKRASMTKAERLSASRRKKKADPGQQSKSGAAKPTYVATDKKKKVEEAKDLLKVAKELTKASKMHKGQAEKLKKHADDMKTVDEACWKGYKAYGMKKKGGKMVPNCKPVGSVKKEGASYGLYKGDGKVKIDGYEKMKAKIGSKKKHDKPAIEEAKVDQGRSDYGKASIRNYRRKGPGHGEPAMFDPENKRGKLIDKRREEHKARRGVKGAKVPAYKVDEGAAWTKKAGKNKEGGLNEKGRKSYERDNPGSDLKAPSKKVGNPRRASFCARMKGMKKKLTSAKTARDPDSRINKSLRKWNCEYEPQGNLIGEEGYDRMRDDRLVKYGTGHDGSDRKSKTNYIRKPDTPEQKKRRQAASDRAYSSVVASLKKKYGDGVMTRSKKIRGGKEVK